MNPAPPFLRITRIGDTAIPVLAHRRGGAAEIPDPGTARSLEIFT
jgi:hypothetical protein